MEHRVVSRITEGWFLYQGWPTIAKDKNGTLYIACSSNRLAHVCPFGKDVMYVSHDEGKTWSAPQIINDTKLDDRDAGLICWGDGNMLLTWFNNQPWFTYTMPSRASRWPNLVEPLSLAMIDKWKELGPEEYGSFTRISRDYGKTWSKPRRAPVTCPHGAIRRADGSLMYVGLEVQSGFGIPGGSVTCAVSTDDGETWSLQGILPKPKTHNGKKVLDICEPHCVDLGDDVILAAVRCVVDGDAENELAQTYHMTTYLSRSEDGGKTWSEAQFMERLGAPPHLMVHSSGALIFSFGRRVPPYGQHVRVSYDKGLTWSEDVKIGADTNVTDQGYPSTVELSNGELLTAYYQRCPGDEHTSILCSQWSLSDIK